MNRTPTRKVEKAKENKTSPAKSIANAPDAPIACSALGVPPITTMQYSIILTEDNYALWANNCRMRLRAVSPTRH